MGFDTSVTVQLFVLISELDLCDQYSIRLSGDVKERLSRVRVSAFLDTTRDLLDKHIETAKLLGNTQTALSKYTSLMWIWTHLKDEWTNYSAKIYTINLNTFLAMDNRSQRGDSFDIVMASWYFGFLFDEKENLLWRSCIDTNNNNNNRGIGRRAINKNMFNFLTLEGVSRFEYPTPMISKYDQLIKTQAELPIEGNLLSYLIGQSNQYRTQITNCATREAVIDRLTRLSEIIGDGQLELTASAFASDQLDTQHQLPINSIDTLIENGQITSQLNELRVHMNDLCGALTRMEEQQRKNQSVFGVLLSEKWRS